MAIPNLDDTLPQNSVEQQVFGQAAAQQYSMQQQSSDKQVPEFNQIAAMISDVDRRIRILEERYSNLRKKINLTDQNLLESERGYLKELRELNDEVMEMKHSVNDFQEKIMIFNSEMQSCASKVDLKVIEKYLNLWSPSMFVTRRELREFLRSRGLIEKREEE